MIKSFFLLTTLLRPKGLGIRIKGVWLIRIFGEFCGGEGGGDPAVVGAVRCASLPEAIGLHGHEDGPR